MYLNPRKAPAPAATPESAPFWNAAKDGKLLLRACNSCKQSHYYPRSICPNCFSSDTDWQQASGKGHIYSFSVMRKAEVPYAIAYVALEEGPVMMSNIVECEEDAVKIGAAVEVVFQPTTGDIPLPMFRLRQS